MEWFSDTVDIMQASVKLYKSDNTFAMDIEKHVTICLQKLFKDRWEKRSQSTKWNGLEESRLELANSISEDKRRKFKQFLKIIEDRNESEWNINIWYFIMLDSGLSLLDQSLKKDVSNLKKATKEMSKVKQGSTSNYDKIVCDVRSAISRICGSDVEQELHSKVQSQSEKQCCTADEESKHPIAESIMSLDKRVICNKECPPIPNMPGM